MLLNFVTLCKTPPCKTSWPSDPQIHVQDYAEDPSIYEEGRAQHILTAGQEGSGVVVSVCTYSPCSIYGYFWWHFNISHSLLVSASSGHIRYCGILHGPHFCPRGCLKDPREKCRIKIRTWIGQGQPGCSTATLLTAMVIRAALCALYFSSSNMLGLKPVFSCFLWSYTWTFILSLYFGTET